ncbi:hypothetical protein [Cupriavidus agavae]|uniref:Uncharacterized protein n=1 Tax=Cupriavidus agavae TaxID=1001822 RepID=A0A4Q7RWR0_9BURK|nr:hypothetical protein [Cupriavidus agavae]RZT38364.1 hypothetical protein EV147_2830 [Cupriavidus agavae]
MEQNNKRILNTNEIQILLFFLQNNGQLNRTTINDKGWGIAELDDKALFDEDAENIGNAFAAGGAAEFFVAKIDDLVGASYPVESFAFSASLRGVEQFQTDPWLELNLEDCLFFSFPIFGLVYRPGWVKTTYVAGREDFVVRASAAPGWKRK